MIPISVWIQTPERRRLPFGNRVRLERALEGSPAFRKIDDQLYVIKQGSDLCHVKCAPLARASRGALNSPACPRGGHGPVLLALELLEMNAHLRFGNFGYCPTRKPLCFHTPCSTEKRQMPVNSWIRSGVSRWSQMSSTPIANRYGGQTMQDLIEENTLRHLHELKTPSWLNDPEANA